MNKSARRRSLPLQGRAILVTRPRAQAGALAQRIHEAGGDAVLMPTVEIEPIDPSPQSRVQVAQLRECDLAVFVSVNAVRCAWPLIEAAGGWPPELRAAAVGRSTADELLARGVKNLLVPVARSDSEALLCLPALQHVRGWRTLVFRGQGGRELLADTLRGRGAQVEYVECYRRVKPSAPTHSLDERLRAGTLDGITATSAESLRNLVELLGEASPFALPVPVFAMHPKIAAAARTLGFGQVVLTESGDEGLLRGMMMFFSGPAASG
jgi:uroporphyrinogen-III synthase